MVYEILYLLPQQKLTWNRTLVSHLHSRATWLPVTRGLCENLSDLIWHPSLWFSAPMVHQRLGEQITEETLELSTCQKGSSQRLPGRPTSKMNASKSCAYQSHREPLSYNAQPLFSLALTLHHLCLILRPWENIVQLVLYLCFWQSALGFPRT